MDSFFGTPEQEVGGGSTSGYGALPPELQARFTQLGGVANKLLKNPSQYFAPQGINPQEQSALDAIMGLMNPAQVGVGTQSFMNPYRDIMTQDINKAYGDEYSALKSRASEAGAFGGSRMRMGESDLERSRMDAITSALQNMFLPAQQNYLNTQQTGISNLLGFGGLQRGIDIAQRSAPATAFSTVASGVNPWLNASTSTNNYTQAEDSGTLGDIGKIANLVGTVAAFSDRRLKENIKRVGTERGLPTYEYNYLWSPQKFIGFMSDEVKKLYPKAVSQIGGYDIVDYGVING
jgi:hypothetical protein